MHDAATMEIYLGCSEFELSERLGMDFIPIIGSRLAHHLESCPDESFWQSLAGFTLREKI